MPKVPAALQSIPPAAAKALKTLGEDLAIARTRRHESQRAWAKRLGVSVPTLIRLERGDSGVSMGIYATALWLIGAVDKLSHIATAAADLGALETEVRNAIKRRTVRSAASVKARLGKKPQRARPPR